MSWDNPFAPNHNELSPNQEDDIQLSLFTIGSNFLTSQIPEPVENDDDVHNEIVPIPSLFAYASQCQQEAVSQQMTSEMPANFMEIDSDVSQIVRERKIATITQATPTFEEVESQEPTFLATMTQKQHGSNPSDRIRQFISVKQTTVSDVELVSLEILEFHSFSTVTKLNCYRAATETDRKYFFLTRNSCEIGEKVCASFFVDKYAF
ncbi:hypothetical protein PCE1_001222 [Barthelona sp. PCE]